MRLATPSDSHTPPVQQPLEDPEELHGQSVAAVGGLGAADRFEHSKAQRVRDGEVRPPRAEPIVDEVVSLAGCQLVVRYFCSCPLPQGRCGVAALEPTWRALKANADPRPRKPRGLAFRRS